MSLSKNINAEIKTAMLGRDEVKLRALRAIKSAFLLAEREKGNTGDLSEQQELKILQKLFKQRKDSLDIYVEQDRSDLAEKEKEEMDIIGEYLPKQMSDEDLSTALKEILETNDISSMKDMSKAMGMAMKSLSGKADGSRISAMIKTLLA